MHSRRHRHPTGGGCQSRTPVIRQKAQTRNDMNLFKIINEQLGEIIELKCQAEADADAIRQLQNENYRLQAAQRQLKYELYFNSNAR